MIKWYVSLVLSLHREEISFLMIETLMFLEWRHSLFLIVACSIVPSVSAVYCCGLYCFKWPWSVTVECSMTLKVYVPQQLRVAELSFHSVIFLPHATQWKGLVVMILSLLAKYAFSVSVIHACWTLFGLHPGLDGILNFVPTSIGPRMVVNVLMWRKSIIPRGCWGRGTNFLWLPNAAVLTQVKLCWLG